MTKEELDEATEALRNPREPLGHALALRIADALESLSSPPEDVARDVQRLRLILIEHGLGKELPGTAQFLVTRLATAAARVPGLEARLRESEGNLQTCFGQFAEIAKVLDPEVMPDAWGAHAAAQKVKAERDAAAQEADKWRRMALDRDLQVTTITARGAELEDGLLEERRIGNDFRFRWGTAMEGKVLAEARATATEAQVKALEEQVRVMARVNEALDEAGVPREVPIPGGVGYSERSRIAWLAARSAQPTPAPGLREALAPIMESIRPAFAFPTPGGVTATAHHEVWRKVLAAYDATPPAVTHVTEQTPECATCPERGDFETLCCKAGPHIVVDAATSVTHARLAAVVEQYVSETHEAARAGAIYQDRRDDRCSGAREVLRRATGGQVPEVLLKTRVVEALDQNTYATPSSEAEECSNQTVRDIANALSLTLPTGPSGGEAAPTFTPESIRDMGHSIRSGLAPVEARNPRVTPEVPALAEHKEPVVLGKGPFVMVPEVAASAVERTHRAVTDAQPEPAAPEVVHEGKDRWFRVLAGGRIQHRLDVSHRWVDLTPASCWENTETWLNVTGELTRALAEAKRELAGSVRPEALAAVRKAAAEDMRARCASVIREHIRTNQNDLLKLWDDILALPLE